MLTIKFDSLYQTKEENKRATKLLIEKLKPIIKSGTIVANEKKIRDGNPFFRTVLNIESKKELLDLSEVGKFLKVMLSNNWDYEYSGVHAPRFSLDIEDEYIDIPFIKFIKDSDTGQMLFSVYIVGSSEQDVINKLKKVFNEQLFSYTINDIVEYFKIDNCYIVDLKLQNELTLDQFKPSLLQITDKWRITGLEVHSSTINLDPKFKEINISFQNVAL